MITLAGINGAAEGLIAVINTAGGLFGGLAGGGLAGGGPLGGAPDSGLLGGGLAQTLAGAGLDAIDSWVLDGARSALRSVAHLIGISTAPHLQSAWFSASYWRVAALASLLTVPFLFAAAVQALIHADLALLSRAALVHLPLALVGVSLAAPIVMLLLAATDEMCVVVSGPGSAGGARFLSGAAIAAGGASALAGSPFFAIVVGLLTVAAALGLMLELLVREAAVYVVVLMLPLAFTALVWPARRIWAARLLELLLALILSKLAIVAVLSLAGSALGHTGGVPHLLVAMALLLLSCAAPWALLRIIPFTELAAGVSESLRHHGQHASSQLLTLTGSGLEQSTERSTYPPRCVDRRSSDVALTTTCSCLQMIPSSESATVPTMLLTVLTKSSGTRFP